MHDVLAVHRRLARLFGRVFAQHVDCVEHPLVCDVAHGRIHPENECQGTISNEILQGSEPHQNETRRGAILRDG